MNVRVSLVAVVSAILVAPLVHAADPSGQHFIKESIEGNLAEVKVGGLAEQKGVDQGVKEFGATLAKDHTTANEKAKQVAQTLGVTPPTDPGLKQKAIYQELSALSGAKFDKQFVHSMVKDHEEDIAKYEKEANSGSGPAAEYAKKILPDLRKHLQMAQRLQEQQRTASASGASSLK
jgi:putative membrane protein